MRGFGELGGGMSATWWSDKHNMHHALTNVVSTPGLTSYVSLDQGRKYAWTNGISTP
jgi:fatty-acid desaturase